MEMVEWMETEVYGGWLMVYGEWSSRIEAYVYTVLKHFVLIPLSTNNIKRGGVDLLLLAVQWNPAS